MTGASGLIGSNIVQRLLSQNYHVRILSRKNYIENSHVEVFKGGLEDEEVLEKFTRGAQLLFHCAAELHDHSKMWEVNVLGTERLLRAAKKSDIKYFCYLSSAGVVGETKEKWVNESIKCAPQNVYENSKWEAEKLVLQEAPACKTVVLRPTNVIDTHHPGALSLTFSNSWVNRLKIFIKGGECAHIIHADDVADAAMFFTAHTFNGLQCFFVSCDHEPLNTFAGIRTLCKAIKNNQDIDEVEPVSHAPLIIPYFLRKLRYGQGNKGDVRYSSKKLFSTGFTFDLGLRGAVQKVISME